MPSTLISNATIVTGDARHSIHYGSAIAVENGAIAAIGPTHEVLSRYPSAEVVNGSGRAVFPGFINCHAHVTATIDRGITDDFGFPFPFRFPENVRSFLTDEELTVMAMLGAIECIRTGSTGTAEVAEGIERYAESIAASGLRWFLAECSGDGVTGTGYKPGEPVNEFSDARREQAMERGSRLFEKWHGHDNGRVRCMTGATLVETSSPALLRQVRELAERHNCGYTIHLDQSRLEIETVLRMHGMRPAAYLAANDFLGPGLLAAHLRYPDESEIAILGQSGAAVSHQPAMAARRGVIPPIPALRDAGCTIGMGTDNNTQDMVEVMRIGMLTERILRDDPANPQPEDALEMATMGSAKALGMEGSIGSLEVGKRADLVIVNTMRSNLAPNMRVVSSFVNNGQPSDIESVMVDGKFVMRQGKILTVDEETIVREADRIGRRAWRRLTEKYPNVEFPVGLAPG